MYNGIGLNTARGSGTNGYVQTNKAYIKEWKVKKADGFIDKLDIPAPEIKAPNEELLLHEKKRKIEVKVYEYRLELEEKGLKEEEIEKKCNQEREYLLKQMEKESERKNKDETKRKRDEKQEFFHKKNNDGHLIKEAQILKNQRAQEALRIKKDYKVGESFNFKKKNEEKIELNQKDNEEKEILEKIKKIQQDKERIELELSKKNETIKQLESKEKSKNESIEKQVSSDEDSSDDRSDEE